MYNDFLLRQYAKVLFMMIFDIMSTFVYMSINPNAVELNPLYDVGNGGPIIFFWMKIVSIPAIFFALQIVGGPSMFDEDGEYWTDICSFMYYFYSLVVIYNLVNIAVFIS